MVTKEEAQVIVASKDTLQQRPSPDSTVHASIVPEKPSEDGYNWRKYGQKNVKGNEYIRSYYKCSYPNCLVKKQVERSLDGRITDITYLGKHDHPRPHFETQEAVPSLPSVKEKTPDCPLSVVKDKPSDGHAPTKDKVQPQPMAMCERPTNDEHDTFVDSSLSAANQARDIHNANVTPKKRKRSVDGADIITEIPTHESRIVVHTVSEVDIVNDGYRWRKYGQKMVKGNPNPRSYYRCSTAGCPVKKHVERASHDPKVVITTYEGQHDHSIPPIRTAVPQSGTPSGDSISKSLESDAAQNGSLICEAEKNDAVGPNAKEITTKEVVKTEREISPGEQEAQPEAKRSHQNELIKNEITSSEKQMEDNPSSTASNPDNIDHQTVKQQKVAPILEMKIEGVSTEQQRPDVDHQTVKQEKLDAVQGMKMEDVSTEQKTPIDHQIARQEKMDPVQEMKIEGVSTERQRHANGDHQTVKQEKVDMVQETKMEEVSTEQQTRNSIDHQIAKQEKMDPVQEMKIEDVSTEQQRPDELLERSHVETKSNEQQRPSAEPVNCST